MSYSNDFDKFSRKIAEEFKSTYGALEEKAHKIPDAEAEELAKKFNVSVEIARVACQIEMDGVVDRESALKLLMMEYERLAKHGINPPPIPTYEFYFAVKEGKWIEYLWKRFVEGLTEYALDLYNISQTIDSEENVEIWHVTKIIEISRNAINKIIEPIMKEWLKEHRYSTVNDLIKAFSMGTLKILDPEEALKRFGEKKEELKNRISLFERVIKETGLTTSVMENLAKYIRNVKEGFDSNSLHSVSYVILNLITPPESVIKESDYMIVHTPIPRRGMVGPDLTTPIDFLEMYVKLAMRREKEERFNIVQDITKRVLHALVIEGNRPKEGAMLIVKEVKNRFNLDDLDVEKIREEIEKVNDSERDLSEYLVSFIYNYVLGESI
ncbi:MAG: hypothetical protein ACTSR0_06660 [Candidatus Asgardarchaeia archaeon]